MTTRGEHGCVMGAPHLGLVSLGWGLVTAERGARRDKLHKLHKLHNSFTSCTSGTSCSTLHQLHRLHKLQELHKSRMRTVRVERFLAGTARRRAAVAVEAPPRVVPRGFQLQSGFNLSDDRTGAGRHQPGPTVQL